MKKIFSALLAVAIMLSFCACTAKKETALVISGAEIDTEIFTYFFHRIVKRPSDYGIDAEAKDKVFKETAISSSKPIILDSTSSEASGA